jgi:hypothetical protein
MNKAEGKKEQEIEEQTDPVRSQATGSTAKAKAKVKARD